MDILSQPKEIFVLILNYLSSKEIMRLFGVSKSLYYQLELLMPYLILDFSFTTITDAGLVHLKGVYTINLWSTKITDA